MMCEHPPASGCPCGKGQTYLLESADTAAKQIAASVMRCKAGACDKGRRQDADGFDSTQLLHMQHVHRPRKQPMVVNM
jgi:tRNA G37 N-methylase TrmD